MGAWGTGLYSNDATSDLKEDCIKLLQKQLSNEEAYEKILEKYKEYIGDVDEPFFWYALADTQWTVGRLMPFVKNKALEYIEKRGGIELWEESKNRGAGWLKTLEKLKIKLESPMPPERKIRKPKEFIKNPWEVGDVYAYKIYKYKNIEFKENEFKENPYLEKYICIQKLADIQCFNDLSSCVQIYKKMFDEIPTLEDLSNVPILPMDVSPDRFISGERHSKNFPIILNTTLYRYKKGEYKEKDYYFIGNMKDNYHYTIDEMDYHYYDSFEMCFLTYFEHWKNYEFTMLDNGECLVKKINIG